MKTKTRRGVRATTAVAVAGSLLGAQALVSAAAAGTTTVVGWTPAAGPSLWSDSNCTSGGAAPSNTPASPPSDALPLTVHGYVSDSGPHSTGSSDTAWTYAPAASSQGGPVVTIPTSTTGMSIDVGGATSGRLMVIYNSTSNNQTTNYVGVWNFATTASWQTVTAGSLTWYRWQPANLLTQAGWQPANTSLLQSQNLPMTLGSFLNGKPGTAQAAFELGCTGTFSIDHLTVTDSNTNVTDYDLQTPTSSTSISQGATRVSYGGSTTIATSTSSTDNGVTTNNPAGTDTLQSSTDGGTIWTTVATGPTNATGPTTFTVKPTRTTLYRVGYSSSTALDPQPSTSGQVSVAVAPTVRLSSSTSSTNVKKSVTFTTRLQPALANVTVTFKQASGTSWASIGTATTNSTGVATLVRSRSTMGAWKVESSIGARPGYLSATSNAVTVKVYQPVSLSIYRSYSTVYVGRSFRIYGTMSPHWSGIPLQLQQYVGGRWIVVASGHTGTRGAYSFTKTARSVGTASFRVVAPASGYRRMGRSAVVKVSIVRAPVYTPPPPPPPPPGGGGSGIG